MLIDPSALKDIGHAIQLALAPAFLLTAIAGTLNVMTGRLARIIDRGREVMEGAASERSDEDVSKEVRGLERRRHLASVAITATTFSALLVCIVVATLFIDVLLAINLNLLVGVLFACSSLALVVGLAFFLREVQLATMTVRIRSPRPGR